MIVIYLVAGSIITVSRAKNGLPGFKSQQIEEMFSTQCPGWLLGCIYILIQWILGPLSLSGKWLEHEASCSSEEG
jgi:hypothetical protein